MKNVCATLMSARDKRLSLPSMLDLDLRMGMTTVEREEKFIGWMRLTQQTDITLTEL